MNCIVCGEAGHRPSRCAELRTPLKDGFQGGGGGGGGHSHDDDEDERLRLMRVRDRIQAGEVPHHLRHEVLPIPVGQQTRQQSHP